MERKKVIFIAFGCIAGAFVLYWIVSFVVPLIPAPSLPKKSPQTGFVPQYAESLPNNAPQLSNITQEVSTRISQDLTQEFVSKLSGDATAQQELKEKIEKGDLSEIFKSGKINEYLTLDSLGFATSVSSTELHVSSDTSASAKKTYADAYLKIMNDFNLTQNSYTLITAVEGVFYDNSTTLLDKVIQVYQNTLYSVQNLTVPVAFVSFQEKNVLFLKNSIILFSSIRQYNTDPLRAYAAIQNFSYITNAWSGIAKEIPSLSK